MSSSDRSERRIALAAVAGAQGVKGELRLKLFGNSLESLSVHQKLYIGGTQLRLLSVRQSGKTIIARVEGVADRSGAESFRGFLVEVDRSALPPLEEGEYYYADLIGLPAVDREGNSLGTVCAVENYGAGELLEIDLGKGRRSLIPLRPGIAEERGGRIILDPMFLA